MQFSDISFTSSVLKTQCEKGTRERVAKRVSRQPARDRLGPQEQQFILQRDSFYMASVNSDGWPYVQHRGGKPGFLQVLNSTTLSFVEAPGNGEYVSLGNLRDNQRVALILMDYPNRRRLKIFGCASMVEAEQGAIHCVIELKAFDWNCAQFITPRFSEAVVEELIDPLKRRIQELEQQLFTRQSD